MKAVLFSRFVSSHIEQTILPRLKARGIDVIRVVDFGRSPDIPPGDYELLLFMFEMCSHSECDTIKAAATRAGKRFIMLPRKSAQWPDELRDDAAPASARGVVMPPSDRLVPMLQTLVSLRDAGQNYDTIAPQLTQYWPPDARNAAPRDGAELRALIEAARTSPAAPPFFRQWLPSGLKATDAAAAGDDDDAELLKLYEQEVSDLKEQVRLALEEATKASEERNAATAQTKRLASDLTRMSNEMEEQLRTALKATNSSTTIEGVERTAWRQELAAKTSELASALDEARTWKEQYDKLRERHASELSEHNRVLQSTRDALNAANEALDEKARQEIANFKAPCAPSNGLAKLTLQVRPLVPALLTAEEALDRLVAYAEKQES